MSLNWRDLPPLSALRAFDATARHGGFAGAARSLNVTHAAVAQQVRALEARMGVALAVRAGRSVKLTEAGERLARGLGQGFEAIAESVEEVRRSERRRGLRVTTTTYVADLVIVPRLPEFWARNPGVEIALHPSRDYVDLQRDGYDLAIRAVLVGQKAGWPGADMSHLARARVIAVGAPDLVGDPPRDPTDCPWLWHAEMDVVAQMMRTAGLDTAALQRVPIASASLKLEAVRRGMGAAVFNEWFVREDLKRGRLVELPLPNPAGVDYYIVTPKGVRRELTTTFADWLRALFGDTSGAAGG